MTRVVSPGMAAGREVESLPNLPGAYLLAIDLARPLALNIATLAGAVLAPGRYVYAGSAYGPGGIRARLARHLRSGKAIHWHVDRLVAAGRIVAVHAEPAGIECALLAQVLGVPGSDLPVPGFGSTDCRRCPAHLAAVPADFDLRASPNRLSARQAAAR